SNFSGSYPTCPPNRERSSLRQAWQDWREVELSQLDALHTELREEADTIVAGLRAPAVIDLSHALVISQRSEMDGYLSVDERNSVANSLKWYFSDVTTYAWNFENDAGRALFVEGWDTSIDISRESFEAWRESYQEQVEDDQ
ncbi:MAG: hypothetical protein ACTHWA_13640, partial [Arachnia sp.]